MRRTACIILLAVVAVACDSAKPTVVLHSRSVTYPLTISGPNGPVEIPRQPLRIVSLSPTATEILFAIGAGPQVVAVDDQSNYPANAPKTKLSGFEPNVEAIAKYSPDLVVFANDVKQLAKSLTALKIPALLQPAATSLDDTYEQITQLGNATDHPNEADKLAARMKKDIATIAADAPTFTSQPRFYYEVDSTYFSATSSTFIGKVFALLHLRNIADPADKQSSGYPQLSPEYIIQSDPDLIFLGDTKYSSQSATTVAKRPGWSGITAVKNDAVIALDDDIAQRWGPRIVDFLRTVGAALKGLEKAA